MITLGLPLRQVPTNDSSRLDYRKPSNVKGLILTLITPTTKLIQLGSVSRQDIGDQQHNAIRTEVEISTETAVQIMRILMELLIKCDYL